jgi:hypothetical protein
MVIDQGAQPCAYKGCTCDVPAGQTYCGPHCANASIETDAAASTSCGCGHSPCNGDAEPEVRSDIEHA